MNWWIFAGGTLSLLTAAIHVFLGGREIHLPVQLNDSLGPEVRAVMAVVWHGITASLVLSGLALIYAAWIGGIRSTVAFIVTQYLAMALLFIGYGAIRFGRVLVIPQWTLFVVIIALTCLGLRQQGRTLEVSGRPEVHRMLL